MINQRKIIVEISAKSMKMKIKFLKILLYFLPIIVSYRDANAIELKYEPPYSYGIILGPNLHVHQYAGSQIKSANGDFEQDFFIFPFISLFAQIRFYKRIFGVTFQTSYKNRNYVNTNNTTGWCKKASLHCLDLSLLFNLMPKGYGGINIYFGPTVYILTNATRFEENSENVEVSNVNINNELNNYNLGLLVGFNLEIDRTGFLIGFEYDTFFLSTSKEVKNASAKNFELQKMKNSRSFRLYLGYDFGRLHCS